MFRYIHTIVFLVISISLSSGQLIESILEKGGSTIQQVLANVEKHEVQIMYSQISRSPDGVPSLKNYRYRVDENLYFYPASTAKFPVVLCAMEKLNSLNDDRLTMNTPIAFGAQRDPQVQTFSDPTAKNNQISLNHLIKKVMVVSDNDANNLLYSFCGQQYIHDNLQDKGYRFAKITDRIGASEFSHEDNRSTNPFLFYQGDEILYVSPGVTSTTNFTLELEDCIKGKAHMTNGKLINEPFNFCYKNFLSIPTLHDLLVSVVLPEGVEDSRQLDITEEQRRALLSFMSQRPRESIYPKYSDEYYDSYVKFFLVGDNKDPMPDDLRIFNKVGFAHGYLTDVAYVVDLERKVEFILVATIHVNSNETFNDDTYDYDSIGIPFLSEIGRLFYEHELTRNHTFDPRYLRSLTYD